MKKMFIVFLMIVLCGVLISAENLKFSSLALTSGKGAFVSGFDASVFLDNTKIAMEVTGNNDRSYVAVFRKISKFKVGMYTGIFKNMIHAGPYVTLNLKPVSFFYWQGWGFGRPEMPNWKLKSFFQNVGVSINPFGGLRVGYIYCKFLGDKFHIPGISYSIQINEHISVLAGCDYKIAYGQNTGDPLYRVGVTYRK